MKKIDYQIIKSRADNDTYKFSMAQAVYHNYTDAIVRYELAVRSQDVDFSEYLPLLKEQIESMDGMRFIATDLAEMSRKAPFLKPDFLHYLNNSVLTSAFVQVFLAPDKQGGIRIVIEGPWLETIWFEVPILAILSEIHTLAQLEKKKMTMEEASALAKVYLSEKIYRAQNIYGMEFPKFADFGTRRRASLMVHREVLDFLNIEYDCCLGTSNVMLGIENDMKLIGTMAHEWIMAHAGFTRFDLSQKMALDVWQKEYRDQLGIALTDTYTTDFFLKDFDSLLAGSFSGVRQDSGDPFEVGYKFIRHYESLGIDPMTKQIVFSDSLNFDKICRLHKEFEGKIKIGFGIGTNLTSDIGTNPLNAVIKMTHIKRGNEMWYPTIKLSDVEGKTMCQDKEYASFIKKIVKERCA